MDRLITTVMLNPGTPETVFLLVLVRYFVLIVNVAFLVYLSVNWAGIIAEFGLLMVALNLVSLTMTLALRYASLRGEWKGLVPLVLSTLLFDMTILVGGCMISGMTRSPIIFMPILTVMMAALVLGTRSALVTFLFFAVAYPIATVLVETGIFPYTAGPAWEAAGGIESYSGGINTAVNQLMYYTLVIVPFLVAVDRLRTIYRNYYDQLAQAAAQIEAATEQRHREENLVQLGQMASFVAHEIRNALSVLRGGAWLCKTNPGDPGLVEECADDSIAQVDRLGRMMENLLAYSKEFNADPQEFDLVDLVGEVIASHPARVRWRIHGVRPVRADREQLEQVLVNLLRNASQATDSAGTMAVDCLQDEGDHLLLEVHDDGPGIPKDNREAVFQPFYSSKGKRGTGLGLAICRRICEANGITLEIDDSPLGGTCMRLAIPRAAHGTTPAPDPAAESGERPAPEAHAEAARPVVLTVEDELLVQRYLVRVIERAGMRAVRANTLKQARHALQLDQPAVVLLDLQLGDEQGADLFDDLAGLEAPPPVIICSGLDEERRKRELEERGAAAYLVKPVLSDVLVDTIEAQLERDTGDGLIH